MQPEKFTTFNFTYAIQMLITQPVTQGFTWWSAQKNRYGQGMNHPIYFRQGFITFSRYTKGATCSAGPSVQRINFLSFLSGYNHLVFGAFIFSLIQNLAVFQNREKCHSRFKSLSIEWYLVVFKNKAQTHKQFLVTVVASCEGLTKGLKKWRSSVMEVVKLYGQSGKSEQRT